MKEDLMSLQCSWPFQMWQVYFGIRSLSCSFIRPIQSFNSSNLQPEFSTAEFDINRERFMYGYIGRL